MIRQQDAHRESRKQAAASYSRYLGDMRLPAQSTAWYVGKTRLQWERVPPPRRRRRHRRRTRATKVSGTIGGRGTSAAWGLPACLTGALLPSACFLNPARHRDDAHGGYPVVRPQQLGRPWSSKNFHRAALHQTMPCHAPLPICTRAWFFFSAGSQSQHGPRTGAGVFLAFLSQCRSNETRHSIQRLFPFFLLSPIG